MKSASLLPVFALAFIHASAASAADGSAGTTAGADTACCGSFGDAGPWGGSSQFSLCIAGATCTDASHTQVGVTYFSGSSSCPGGSYDCVVTVGPLNCGYSCQDQSGCGAYSPSPSCCGGLSDAAEGCPDTQFRGCCLANEIMMPSAIQGSSSEWIVSYGDGLPGVADAATTPSPGQVIAAVTMPTAPASGCTVGGSAPPGGLGALLVLALLVFRRRR